MTLKNIAYKAGVSISTVSRALNDSFDVSPETKERILRIEFAGQSEVAGKRSRMTFHRKAYAKRAACSHKRNLGCAVVCICRLDRASDPIGCGATLKHCLAGGIVKVENCVFCGKIGKKSSF